MRISREEWDLFTEAVTDILNNVSNEECEASFSDMTGLDKGKFFEIWETVGSLPVWVTNANWYRSSGYVYELGTVPVFKDHPNSFRDQALKVIEESAELFAAAEFADSAFLHDKRFEGLAEETADVIQAAVNMLDMLPRFYESKAMRDCYTKNARRGRY